MAEHILKTVGYCWDAVASGAKKFEVRYNDRGFQPGDTVVLRRTDAMGHVEWLTDALGCENGHLDLTFRIGWMLQGGQFGIEPGYCVFSLEPRNQTAPITKEGE